MGDRKLGYLQDLLNKTEDNQNLIVVGTGIILINENKEIFIANRVDNGEWSIPGGSLEVGESLEDCIVRELYEETGIVVNKRNLRLNSVKSIQEPVLKNGRQIYVVSISYYTNKFDIKGFKLNEREFSEYKWESISDLIRMNLTVYSRVAIEEFINNKLLNL